MTDTILTLGIDSRPSQEGSRQYVRSADDIIRKSQSAAGAVNKVEGSFIGLQKAAFGLRSGLATLGIGLSLSALVVATKRAIDLGDAINDMSKRTGVAVETLSKLKYVADQNGTSLEGVANGLKFMNRNFAEAESGNAQARQSFTQLGISIDELGKLDTEKKLLLIADRISNLGKESDRTKALMDIFGRSGDELGIIMLDGAEGIKKATDEAEKLGIVFSKEQAATMDEFNDKLSAMGNIVQYGLAKSFVVLYDAVNDAKDALALFLNQGALISDKNVPSALSKTTDEIIKQQEKLADLRQKGYPEDSNYYKANAEQLSKLKDQYDDLLSRQGGLNEQTLKARGLMETPGGKGKGKLTGGTVDTEKNRDRERDIEQLQKYIEKERQQNITLREQVNYIGLTTIEIEKLKAARELDAEVAEKTLLMAPDMKAQFYEQAEAIKQNRLEIMQFNYDQSRTFGAGTSQAMSDYLESIGDAASRARNFWENSFKGMEDALLTFVKTGKLSFSNLAGSIIDDLIRIQIQSSITGPLAGVLKSFSGNIGSFFSGGFNNAGQAGLPWQTFGNVNPSGGIYTGFANGGIMTSSGSLPLHTYSNGGIANSPQMAVFGEGRMNEAYVPLPDGRSIPVSMKGGASSSVNTSVTVNVNSNGTANGESRSDSDVGRMLGERVRGVVQEELLKQMRPGGLLKQQAA